MNRIMILFLFSMLTIIACQKENIDDMNVDIIPNTPTIIDITNGDVAGKVIDEDGNALVDALITLKEKQTYTNEYGLFLFQDAELNSQGTYLTVQKDGYFNGSRTFVPASTASQNVLVQLLEKTSVGTFSTSQASTVEVVSGTSIDFQASGIVDATGNVYTGEVNVLAKRLDPLAENLGNIMPGNLTGMNENNQRVALASFGMLAVELESPTGESLQLAEGKSATIHYEVPQELLANAPQSIPLWYFDEANGIWIEDGEAMLQGNAYVGEVSHFTMWNWDIPYDELITLTGQVINKSLEGIEGLTVSIILTNKGVGGYAITDSEGNFSAPLPTNETYYIKVSYQGQCEVELILYEGEIGPFSEDTALAQIIVDLNSIQEISTSFELSGSVVDCNGDPVWALINIQNENGDYIQSVLSDAGGNVNTVVISCLPINEVNIEVIDLTTFEKVEQLIALSSEIDFGAIAVCNGTQTGAFLFIYDSENIYHSESNTDYQDARIEYVECADKYYFEISSHISNSTSSIIGLIAESTEPIVAGMQLESEALFGIDPETVQITFNTVTATSVSGVFTTSDGSQGSFAAPLNN